MRVRCARPLECESARHARVQLYNWRYLNIIGVTSATTYFLVRVCQLDAGSAFTASLPALQSQTHGYTDYPFLDKQTKEELEARLHPLAAVTSGLEKSNLAAAEPLSAVAAA